MAEINLAEVKRAGFQNAAEFMAFRKKHGRESADLALNYGRPAVSAITRHGNFAADAIAKYGRPAISAINGVGKSPFAIKEFSRPAIDVIAEHGSSAMAVILRHGESAIGPIAVYGRPAIGAIDKHGSKVVVRTIRAAERKGLDARDVLKKLAASK